MSSKNAKKRIPRLPVNFLQSLRSNVTGALEKCYSCLVAMLRRLWRKFTECSVKSEMGALRLPGSSFLPEKGLLGVPKTRISGGDKRSVAK